SGGDRGSPTSFEAEGTLDAVDAETGSLTLTHGEIPALKWPAMTMGFVITDLERVKNIAPGTAVRFSFEEGEPGEYIITHIEAATASTAAPAADAAAHSGGH
ncbi:MAG: copper-binding protein, partial [Thauera sp.]|nr:copper-binding protein [Thauera sp.]